VIKSKFHESSFLVASSQHPRGHVRHVRHARSPRGSDILVTFAMRGCYEETAPVEFRLYMVQTDDDQYDGLYVGPDTHERACSMLGRHSTPVGSCWHVCPRNEFREHYHCHCRPSRWPDSRHEIWNIYSLLFVYFCHCMRLSFILLAILFCLSDHFDSGRPDPTLAADNHRFNQEIKAGYQTVLTAYIQVARASKNVNGM